MEAKGRKRENLAAFIRSLGYKLEVERRGRNTSYGLKNEKVSFWVLRYKELDYDVIRISRIRGEFRTNKATVITVKDEQMSNNLSIDLGYIRSDRMKELIQLNAIQS